MDEGMLDGVAAMTRFVNLIASEPDVSKVTGENPASNDLPILMVCPPGAAVYRLVQFPRYRGRSQVLSGKVHRQFHFAEGMRGRFHPQSFAHPSLWRRCSGHGLQSHVNLSSVHMLYRNPICAEEGCI